MKKLFLLLLVFASISANAQWSINEKKGDELLGTSDSVSYLYSGDSGYFVCWDNVEYVKIITDRGIFNYETYYGRYTSYTEKYFYAIVGLYNKDGSLNEKLRCKFVCDDNDTDRAFSHDKDVSYKIISWLMEGKGKVRIIASKYSGADFDLSIPANTQIKNDKVYLSNHSVGELYSNPEI